MVPLDGILVVDKPAGMTSAAVVAQVKKLLGGAKVGHTGTLDPMATGVLPLCIGAATKVAGFLLADDKAYTGELCLGVETDTLDSDGSVVRSAPEAAELVTGEAVAGAMEAMRGDSEQVPPMYSAVRRGGVRLHELARAGVTVERPARQIHVARFEMRSFSTPLVSFEVECSKGTYVRVLASDLGRRLGCGAHLTALRRTRSGGFLLADAITLDQVAARREDLPLVGANRALAHLPEVVVPAPLVEAVLVGKPLLWKDIASEPEGSELVRLTGPSGRLLALASAELGRLRYARVLCSRLT